MPKGIYKNPKISKIKQSEGLKGNQNAKGTKRTKKHIKSWVDVNKGNQYHRGFKDSKETRRKKSEAQKGEKGSNWQGGISFEPYSIDWTRSLRISIRERDHYTCQLCGKKQGDRAFDIHHIDYNKKNCNPENLMTLCANCHTKTSYNRQYWKNYFQSLKVE